MVEAPRLSAAVTAANIGATVSRRRAAVRRPTAIDTAWVAVVLRQQAATDSGSAAWGLAWHGFDQLPRGLSDGREGWGMLPWIWLENLRLIMSVDCSVAPSRKAWHSHLTHLLIPIMLMSLH